MTRPRRILAIDPGERRVGIAVSDPLGITAQGLETFDRRDGDVLDHLDALVARYDVAEIVVGHPRALTGRPTAQTESAEALARAIERRTGVRVVLWDERLTSAEARRVTRGARAPRGAVDRVAAVLILQGYLDARRPPCDAD